MSLTLNYTGAHTDMVQGFSASNGTLTGSQNPYTLAMLNKDVTVYYNLQRTIAGYGEGTGKWAFIASPVAEGSAPLAVGNLIGDTLQKVPTLLFDYDLYRLNPTSEMWENYNNLEHHSNFRLENGKGYLYATKTTKTLTFTGAYNTETNKTLTGLPQGFNLVGNPFIVDAYVNKPYYTLNETGSAIVAEPVGSSIPISPCYGVIVELDGTESVTFNTTGVFSAGPSNGGLQIALSQANTRSNALLDNAIVSFNEGGELGKFYFGEQNANIYIPQNGKEYAIAYSEGVGEMPLNFKAKQNGEYTVTVNPENVEMAYLHLIDNMTGADVDLLGDVIADSDPQSPTPSYSFTAKVTDYESRFRLVFASGASTGSASDPSFAFCNNGDWIILNPSTSSGTAILQTFDMLGRQLSSEEIHSAFSIQHSAFPTPGVYVLRLINGNDVRTQKIVVE